MHLTELVALGWERFVDETAGESPCYAGWAAAVAEDGQVLRWIAGLPEPKQQPNLVLAAARWHGVRAPGPYSDLRDALLRDDGRIRATILARSTQTNEVRRLAAILPLLAEVASAADRPLALLELGTSAGLCLHPDAWSYSWPGVGELPVPGAPRLTCAVRGPMPVPSALPSIACRRGVDLNPVDVTDPTEVAWLRTLIWPEHEERRALLDEAVAVARRDPVDVVAADLLVSLDGLVEEARLDGEVVVLHSAVAAYLAPADRAALHRRMLALVQGGGVHWISLEGDAVLPDLVGAAGLDGLAEERFVLGLDGRAVARVQGHGASLTWGAGSGAGSG